MIVIDALLGYIVRAQDAVWEAENLAIENRNALPAGLELWDLTSLKKDLDRLRKALAAASEAEWAERERSEGLP